MEVFLLLGIEMGTPHGKGPKKRPKPTPKQARIIVDKAKEKLLMDLARRSARTALFELGYEGADAYRKVAKDVEESVARIAKLQRDAQKTLHEKGRHFSHNELESECRRNPEYLERITQVRKDVKMITGRPYAEFFDRAAFHMENRKPANPKDN